LTAGVQSGSSEVVSGWSFITNPLSLSAAPLGQGGIWHLTIFTGWCTLPIWLIVLVVVLLG
jgi:hypothetical protein